MFSTYHIIIKFWFKFYFINRLTVHRFVGVSSCSSSPLDTQQPPIVRKIALLVMPDKSIARPALQHSSATLRTPATLRGTSGQRQYIAPDSKFSLQLVPLWNLKNNTTTRKAKNFQKFIFAILQKLIKN